MSNDQPSPFDALNETDAPTQRLPAAEAGTTTGPTTAVAARPRIRWGAVTWGVLVVLAAACVLILITPEQRSSFTYWMSTLRGGDFVIFGLLALGITILLLAVLAMVRRAQEVRR